MSRRYVTANGSGSVNNGAGVSVSVLNTGLIPGSNVSVRPMGPATMSTHSQSSGGVQTTLQLTNQVISKVFLKAVSKSGGKKASSFKTFMLRNIDTRNISTCSQLRALIRNQLSTDITQGSFDIGYLQNNMVVSVRNEEDLAEIWANLCKGTSVMLWCDGLKQTAESASTSSSRKRKRQVTPESDLECGSEEEDTGQSKRKKKEDKITTIIADLKKRHGDSYTTMQYRIWAEMISGGLHNSSTDPPSTSMFARAGGNHVNTGGSKKSSNDAASCVLNQLTSALLPRPPTNPSSKSDSPGKIIENRSKCYRQLGELKNLHESGLISEDEYARERECIMGTLKNLAGSSSQ